MSARDRIWGTWVQCLATKSQLPQDQSAYRWLPCWLYLYQSLSYKRRRGRGVRGHVSPHSLPSPPQKKNIGKILFGQLLCKIRARFEQNHVKFWNSVNCSYIFFGQKCRAPPLKVDWAHAPILCLTVEYNNMNNVRCHWDLFPDPQCCRGIPRRYHTLHTHPLNSVVQYMKLTGSPLYASRVRVKVRVIE